MHGYKTSIGCCEVPLINCKPKGACFPFLLEESDHDIPIRGYVLNLTLVVSGTVAVVVEKGEKDCYAAVTTGDGSTSGGPVPEGSNNVLLILNNSSTTSNDNDTLTDRSAGGTK